MKTDIHPNYRAVVFQDTSSDLAFLTKSTIETSDTIEWEDGKERAINTIKGFFFCVSRNIKRSAFTTLIFSLSI